MKAEEYDKINPYFRNEIEKFNNKCIESNISIHFNNNFFYMKQKTHRVASSMGHYIA